MCSVQRNMMTINYKIIMRGFAVVKSVFTAFALYTALSYWYRYTRNYMLQYEGKNNVKHSAVTLTVVVNRTICENPKISLGMEIINVPIWLYKAL